jgi:hypothetical protein
MVSSLVLGIAEILSRGTNTASPPRRNLRQAVLARHFSTMHYLLHGFDNDQCEQGSI